MTRSKFLAILGISGVAAWAGVRATVQKEYYLNPVALKEWGIQQSRLPFFPWSANRYNGVYPTDSGYGIINYDS